MLVRVVASVPANAFASRNPVQMTNKARVRLVLVAIVIVLAVVRYPAIRWFVGISVVIGAVVAVILHFVNKRPVRLETDEVRLHLLDDDEKDTTPRIRE